MATITKVTTPDGVTHNIGGGGGANTTYDLSLGTLSSNTVPIKLDGSDGTTDTVYLKGAGTATLSVSGSTITITTSAGQTITYTLSGSGDTTTYTITATPSSGSATSTTIPAATQSAAGMMTSSDKTKLDGITSGAEPNQNAFSHIKVGATTISADTETDTLELIAGTNVTLVPDATNDRVTISSTGGGGGGLSFDDIYPVGSIYMSINNVNPGLLFGGTWEQIEDTFLLAAGSTYTAGNTGGSSTVTLQESELPNITGAFYERRINASADNHMGSAPSGAFSRSDGDGARTVAWASSSTSVVQDQINMSFGSGNAHENMPPYLVVYMWKRVADPAIDYMVDANGNYIVDDNGNYIEVA